MDYSNLHLLNNAAPIVFGLGSLSAFTFIVKGMDKTGIIKNASEISSASVFCGIFGLAAIVGSVLAADYADTNLDKLEEKRIVNILSTDGAKPEIPAGRYKKVIESSAHLFADETTLSPDLYKKIEGFKASNKADLFCDRSAYIEIQSGRKLMTVVLNPSIPDQVLHVDLANALKEAANNKFASGVYGQGCGNAASQSVQIPKSQMSLQSPLPVYSL